MKGVIYNARQDDLSPLTSAIPKFLLPVYNKPMIFYSLSTLMLAGIRKILILVSPEENPLFKRLLGDGSQWGLDLEISGCDAVGDALSFVKDDSCCAIRGDTFLWGHDFQNILRNAVTHNVSMTIFSSPVKDPEGHDTLDQDKEGNLIGIGTLQSNLAVPGLYIYGHEAARLIESMHPIGLAGRYIREGTLKVVPLGRGTAWLDLSTPEDLLQAANFVRAVEERQGLMVACPEELALRAGSINREKIEEKSRAQNGNFYGRYLRTLLEPKA